MDRPIVWHAVLEGNAFEMRGTVPRIDPERLLEYSRSRRSSARPGPFRQRTTA